MLQCTTCYTVQHVTVYNMLHCTTCYSVQHVTVYNMLQCTTCYTGQHVKLYNMLHWTTCYSVQHVTLDNMLHCTTCYTVQHVTLYSMLHLELEHYNVTLFVTYLCLPVSRFSDLERGPAAETYNTPRWYSHHNIWINVKWMSTHCSEWRTAHFLW